MVFALFEQYAQRWPSRRSTPRRETGMILEPGIRTYRDSKITDGSAKSCVALCTRTASDPARTVAFLFKTSIRARLKETTASGSYPAFKTKVRIIPFRIHPHGLRVFVSGTSSQGNKKAPSIMTTRLVDQNLAWLTVMLVLKCVLGMHANVLHLYLLCQKPEIPDFRVKLGAIKLRQEMV
jgi:hypothetical protein